MDFGFFEDEKLLEVFRQNKTKISSIEKPFTFLRHLKDNRLITDELYQKAQKVDCENGVNNGVYAALEFIQKEANGAKRVRKFWECVAQEHILKHHPQLSEIIATLEKFLSPHNGEPNNKTRERSEDRGTGKEREGKSSASNQAGPSSQITNRQKKKAKHMERDLQSSPDSTTESESFSHPSLKEKVNLWDKPKHKRWLPVTCGNKKASLDRDTLFKRKRDCIKHNGEMISPAVFEQRGGKEVHKSWKTSILCQGKTLKSLMELEILKIPKVKGKFTLRK
ncbi:uncharacterized protein LOC143722409 [Siphateles boraxobius]|uniref:uncharacterized protein LOC143722409 n=1 Tax=Siphateles boraxobius TaxID=180520 RepID=UPI004063D842